jgi:hypothetical protein
VHGAPLSNRTDGRRRAHAHTAALVAANSR